MHKIGLIGDKKYNGILHGSPVYVLQVPSHVVKSVNVSNVEDHQKSMERSQPITVDVSGDIQLEFQRLRVDDKFHLSASFDWILFKSWRWTPSRCSCGLAKKRIVHKAFQETQFSHRIISYQPNVECVFDLNDLPVLIPSR